MGGFGAFSLALRNPGVFGAAASLSGALGSLRLMPYPNFARSEFPRMFGPRHGERVQAHDLLLLTAALHASGDRPHLYFDCGKEDYLYEYNAAFKRHLDEIGYPHLYTEYSGEHNWAYWTEHLPDALRFFETCRIKAGL
jgi:S-formylglutathione hydrolase FrmB